MNRLQWFFLNKQKLEQSSRKKRGWLKITLYILLGLFLITGVAGTVFMIRILSDIPDVHTIENLQIAQSTVILDRNGNELYKIHGEENRKYIPLSEIAENARQGTIAIEDKDFYKHPGFDVTGIARALWRKATRGGTLQGGSTITQQLVKIIFLSPERSVERKLKEIILAAQLEQTYSKDKILELYLNQIPYGSNAYGIETAAKTFFNKSAKDLTLIESAILVSLPNGPSYYSPYGPNKDALMGYCKTDVPEASNEFSTTKSEADLKIHIKAKEKVSLTIVFDDGSKKETINLKKGEETDLSASGALSITPTNRNNIELFYEGFALKPFTTKTLAVTRENIHDLLVKPGDLDKKIAEEQNKASASSCKDIYDPNYVMGRKDFVLTRMQEDGYVTADQVKEAWEQGKKIKFEKYREQIKYPHFVLYVKDYLEKKYGQEVVEKGGLRVKTTLDPALQDLAQGMIDKKISSWEKSYLISNTALVTANPHTGQILAMIGSRDYWDEEHDGNVNIALSKRQPGSSFKPFIYAAMLSKGYGAGSIFWDVKTAFGSKTPPNSDGRYAGPVTMRKAIAESRNIPAIKAYFFAGEEDTILEFLDKFGFGYLKTEREEARKKDPTYSYGWPLALGTGEVRMIDMVQGMSVFANGGVKKELTPILEIKDKDGNIVEQYSESAGKTEVVDPQVAYIINNILSDAEARPAGYWRNRITVPGQHVAVKTGTSNKRYGNVIYPGDNWTVGYSTELVTAMWGGNNDGSHLTANAFDINTIAETWKNYMTDAHKLLKIESPDFPQPQGIVKATVSKLTGKLATDKTPDGFKISDIFSSFGKPADYDDSVQRVRVDIRNSKLASDDCPPAQVENRYVVKVHEFDGRPDWDKSIAAWIAGSEALGGLMNEVPKEVSELCVPVSDEQKPTVSIVAPVSFGQVTPGPVNVFLNYSAHFGVDRVEYFLNDAAAFTSKNAPFGGVVLIPREAKVGDSYTIKAVLYDTNGYTAEASVEVAIAEKDSSPPHVSIVSPSEDSEHSTGSNINIQAEAYDDTSTVTKVDFFLDGKSIDSVKLAPYTINYTLPGSLNEGDHEISAEARDNYGNVSKAYLTIRVNKSSSSSSSGGGDDGVSFDIVKPNSGISVDKNTPVDIQYIIKGQTLKNVSLIARRSDGVASVVQEISSFSDQPEHFSVTWVPDSGGQYELFLKVQDSNDQLSYSNRISVTVQE